MNSATVQHSLVAQLEAEILPLLREALSVLTALGPSARSSVFAYPVGSATSYQGFHVGISCLLSGVADSEPDEVSLVFSACHLNGQPRLNAEVAWSNGHVEAELSHGASSSEHWPFATPERHKEILAELPRLIAILVQSAQRGRP
jgi:hypothetical protein